VTAAEADPMTDDASSWTPGLLVAGGVLLDAAKAVAADESVRAVLKVRSGEHLAAIFLFALLGRTASGFDHDGGPDLVFDSHDKSWFPYASPAAFEIKSLPGAYREKLSLLLRNDGPGSNGKLPFPLRLWTAEEVMSDAHPTLLKAERSLARKTLPEHSRNVFLITHPFDHFAVDVAQSHAVSGLMPKKPCYEALDSLWVYWPPGKLVMWSKAAQTWTDILFVTDPDAPWPDESLSFIQNVELTYMAAAGITASPYVFGMEFG
jgi:hypothetical protein